MDLLSFAAKISPNEDIATRNCIARNGWLYRVGFKPAKVNPEEATATMQVQQEGRLSRFVKQLMASRQMTIHEIRRNATAEITESYISGIVKGSSCNPSVRKLVALASGLGVDPVELFKVAAGLEREHESPQSFPAPDAAGFIALMKNIASDDKLLAIMGEALLLEKHDRPAALNLLRNLNQTRVGQSRAARPV